MYISFIQFINCLRNCNLYVNHLIHHLIINYFWIECLSSMVEITSEFNLMRILWWKDSKARTMTTLAGPKSAYNFLWMLANWLLNVALHLSFIPLIWFSISLSFLHQTIFDVSTITAVFKTCQVEILSSELGSWHWWLKIWEQMKRWAAFTEM